MSVDLSGLPELPDTADLRGKARAVKTAGSRVATNADQARNAWLPVNGFIDCDYGAEKIHNAMDEVPGYGEACELGTNAIREALYGYCEEIDGIRDRYNAAVADSMVCYAESTDDDPNYRVNQEKAAQDEVNAVAAALLEMEERCAEVIRQVDPAHVPDPGVFASPGSAVAYTAATTALEHLRVDRYVFDIVETISITRLDVSHLEILFADGSVLSRTEINLRQTVIQQRTRIDVVDARFGIAGEPPSWAKWGGRFIEGADVLLSAWGNGAEEWNQDLIEHPEYTAEERWGSAAKSAAFGAGGSFLGSLGGAAGGAAIGTMICPGVGTVIGAVAGGIIGGWGGEILGNTIDNWTDGEGALDGVKNAWNDFWG
ncbi:hypothetical protein ACQ3I4_13805 [Zafaria sp. Z1313]|uniref:hypothetical protein n=1 Tax=unclassified Zafaria TaxID=2828765 RepID=UPI002E78B393|nr:hypothetical protein [Zafaria sp. J156]MEE1621851.1 hypothetical protein [Zafaria sp. J156]